MTEPTANTGPGIDPVVFHSIALGGHNLPGNASSLSLAGLAESSWHGVVLFVYPKNGTSGCTQEADEFQTLLTDFAAAGVTVAGLSKDTVHSHRRFATTQGYDFPLLADPERRLLKALGLVVAGTMYGKPVQRTERATFLFSRSGRLLRTWRNVQVAGHAATVLASLEPTST